MRERHPGQIGRPGILMEAPIDRGGMPVTGMDVIRQEARRRNSAITITPEAAQLDVAALDAYPEQAAAVDPVLLETARLARHLPRVILERVTAGDLIAQFDRTGNFVPTAPPRKPAEKR